MSPRTVRLQTAAIFLINIALEVTGVTAIVCGPTFQRVFELSKTRLGLVLGAANVGMVIMSPLAGFVTHRHGSRRSLVAGLMLSGGGIVLVGVAPSFPLLLLALVVIGIGWALVGNANATLLADLFPGSLLRVMSLASALWFASSAVSAPLIGLWLQAARNRGLGPWSFRVPYMFDLLAVLAGLVLALVAFRGRRQGTVQQKHAQERRDPPASDNGGAASREWLWIPVLALGHGLMVVVLTSWLSPLVQTKFNANDFQGGLAFGITALGLATGRLLLARWRTSLDERHILAGSFFLGGALFAATIIAPSYPLAMAAAGLGGLGACATFPCILSIVGSRFARVKAKVYGLMHASASLAGLGGPALVGLMADHGVPLWAALGISPVSAWAMGFLALIWIRSRPERTT